MNLRKWHDEVLKRDNYVCQECGKYFGHGHYFNEKGVNQYVCGHHLVSRGSDKSKENDVDNGITVCQPCHYKIHNG